MANEWTAERVGRLSDAELRNLAENARNGKNIFVTGLCAYEIENRKTVAKEKRAQSRRRSKDHPLGSSNVRNIEMDADALLVTLANNLRSNYDLSETTARKLSTKPFRPHRLLSKNGKESKLGGAKKRGQIAIYRYISYRLGNDIVSLAAVMVDKDQGRVTWNVSGPDHLLPNQENSSPESEIKRWARTREVWFDKFSDAENKFRELMSAVAPKSRPQKGVL